jgi:hypothetical protein
MTTLKQERSRWTNTSDNGGADRFSEGKEYSRGRPRGEVRTLFNPKDPDRPIVVSADSLAARKTDGGKKNKRDKHGGAAGGGAPEYRSSRGVAKDDGKRGGGHQQRNNQGTEARTPPREDTLPRQIAEPPARGAVSAHLPPAAAAAAPASEGPVWERPIAPRVVKTLAEIQLEEKEAEASKAAKLAQSKQQQQQQQQQHQQQQQPPPQQHSQPQRKQQQQRNNSGDGKKAGDTKTASSGPAGSAADHGGKKGGKRDGKAGKNAQKSDKNARNANAKDGGNNSKDGGRNNWSRTAGQQNRAQAPEKPSETPAAPVSTGAAAAAAPAAPDTLLPVGAPQLAEASLDAVPVLEVAPLASGPLQQRRLFERGPEDDDNIIDTFHLERSIDAVTEDGNPPAASPPSTSVVSEGAAAPTVQASTTNVKRTESSLAASASAFPFRPKFGGLPSPDPAIQSTWAPQTSHLDADSLYRYSGLFGVQPVAAYPVSPFGPSFGSAVDPSQWSGVAASHGAGPGVPVRAMAQPQAQSSRFFPVTSGMEPETDAGWAPATPSVFALPLHIAGAAPGPGATVLPPSLGGVNRTMPQPTGTEGAASTGGRQRQPLMSPSSDPEQLSRFIKSANFTPSNRATTAASPPTSLSIGGKPLSMFSGGAANANFVMSFQPFVPAGASPTQQQQLASMAVPIATAAPMLSPLPPQHPLVREVPVGVAGGHPLVVLPGVVPPMEAGGVAHFMPVPQAGLASLQTAEPKRQQQQPPQQQSQQQNRYGKQKGSNGGGGGGGGQSGRKRGSNNAAGPSDGNQNGGQSAGSGAGHAGNRQRNKNKPKSSPADESGRK